MKADPPTLWCSSAGRYFTVIWPFSQINYQIFEEYQGMGEEKVMTKIDFRRPRKEWTAVCFDELKTKAKNTTSQYDKVRVSTNKILTNKSWKTFKLQKMMRSREGPVWDFPGNTPSSGQRIGSSSYLPLHECLKYLSHCNVSPTYQVR